MEATEEVVAPFGASDARGADFDGGAGSWLLMAPCGVAWLVAGVDARGCHDVLRPAEVLDLVRRPCTSRSALQAR